MFWVICDQQMRYFDGTSSLTTDATKAIEYTTDETAKGVLRFLGTEGLNVYSRSIEHSHIFKLKENQFNSYYVQG